MKTLKSFKPNQRVAELQWPSPVPYYGQNIYTQSSVPTLHRISLSNQSITKWPLTTYYDETFVKLCSTTVSYKPVLTSKMTEAIISKTIEQGVCSWG